MKLKSRPRLKHIANQLLFALGRTDPITGPLKAFWEITYRCNSRCLNCEIWKRKSAGELTTNQALDVLGQLRDIDVPHISFSGGEPFLRKDFLEVMAAAHSMGFKYSINTNGSLLDDERCRKLAQFPPESIYLSLDGACPETHDKIRGVEGSFKGVLDAVDRLKSHCDPQRTKLFFNTTINKLNLDELPRIARLSLDKKMDGMTMTIVQNVDIFNPAPEMLFGKSEVDRLMKVIDHMLDKYKQLMPHMAEYFHNFRDAVSNINNLYRYRCVAGYLLLMIHPNGDVFSCPVAFEKIGNVTVEPLREIWYNKFCDIRRRIKSGKHPICWFDCVAPINIMMSYIHPLRVHRLFDRELLRYLRHKF